MSTPGSPAQSDSQNLLAIYRSVNADLAARYEAVVEQNARLAGEVRSLTGEIAFLRSRPGYRLVDRAHAVISRHACAYRLAQGTVRRLDAFSRARF